MATIINFYECDQLQHSTKKTCNKDCSSCHKTYCPIHISTSNSEVHKDVKWHIKHSLLMPSVLWRCWLGGRKSTRPVKNRAVGYWHGYLSGARCRCWCHCHSLSLAPCKWHPVAWYANAAWEHDYRSEYVQLLRRFRWLEAQSMHNAATDQSHSDWERDAAAGGGGGAEMTVMSWPAVLLYTWCEFSACRPALSLTALALWSVTADLSPVPQYADVYTTDTLHTLLP